MTQTPKTIPLDVLRDILTYDPKTGKLFWRTRDEKYFTGARFAKMWNTKFAGKEAFTSIGGRGYLHGAIFRKTFTAHRVAFALHAGKWPSDLIDHINGDRTDNRASNLRTASNLQNSQNRTCVHPSNTSGTRGVTWDSRRKRWFAKITVAEKQIALGRYARIEDAVRARVEAESVHFSRPQLRKDFA
jgi:hypothetical protein